MGPNQKSLLLAITIACWTACGSTADADWVVCQNKPTRDCLLEEAFRGDSGPLTGKDRLDVMIQGGALAHPDWVTAADVAEAQRLAPSIREVTGVYYVNLAIHGLVAANQKQQAIDLVASLGGARQTIALNELVRELVKTGDLQTALAAPDRMQPPLDPNTRLRISPNIIASAVKALAENGKIDQALMLFTDQKHLTDAETADMQAAVGQAFAKRGDAKLAQGYFDQATQNLEAARRYAIGPAPNTQLRFAAIRVLALRGQVEAVNAAVQQERSSPDAKASDASTEYERSQGYQRLVGALLEARQPEAALNLAKSLTPDGTKQAALAAVAVWDASNDRLADARAVYASMNNAQETIARVVVVRNLAAYSAKVGDLASALRFVGELRDPTNRRGMLFAIAHILPQ